MLRPLELFLIEFILFILLWLFDDYVATMLCITFAAISFFILAIALIAELLDRSKVPRAYFWYMAVSVIAPIAASVVYLWLFDGDLDWLKVEF